MPSPIRSYFNKFNRGEVDDLAIARDDITKVNSSGSLMSNFVPTRLGPMSYRPGTEYIGAIADATDTYLVPFIASTADTAILEFTNSLLRIWVNDALLTATTRATTISNGGFDSNITTGWTNADEAGTTSSWRSGGYANLLGNGSASASLWQTTTAFAAGEHRVRIVIRFAPVLVEIGIGGAAHNSDIFSGVLGPGIHSLVFTPSGNFDITFSNSESFEAQVDSVSIETTGTISFATNITEAYLPSIRYTQSADVLFIAWGNGQQYKIERRGTNSWSLVDYQVNDGPFGSLNSGDVTLTPGALSGGNVTLTASKGYFVSTDANVLFKLVSQGQEVSASLTAQDTGTNSIRVTGVGASRLFIITVTGITDSTITLQRSTDDTNWTDVESYTTPQSKTLNDGFDNSILYYRLHIKTGNYGTDTVIAALEYEGGSVEGIMRVTSYQSSILVRGNVIQAFGRLDATRDWYRGDWDLKYPTATALYEGRLWWAGRNKTYGSVSDVFDSFDISVLGDAASIQKTIGFGPVDDVQWLLPLNRLLMGIASDELSIRSNSFGDVLTPTNTNIKTGSSQGVDTVAPVAINSRGYFVQRSGERIYELDYSVNQDIHDATDICVLNPSICAAGIKRIAVTMQPEIRIYCVLDDGEARVYMLDKTEDVSAWSRIVTNGTFEDVVVLPGVKEDRVYFSVIRTGGHYLEKLALFSECKGGTTSKHFDSFVSYTSPGTTLTGLDHLNGKTVHVWADGQYRETGVPSGGSMTVSSAWTSVTAGLRYTADYQTSKIMGFVNHSVLTYDKRVVNVGFILKDYWPNSITVGPDVSNLKSFPDIEQGKSVVLTATQSSYDQKPFSFYGEMTTDPRIYIRANNPCTILAMTYGIEESEGDDINSRLQSQQLDYYGSQTQSPPT